MPVLAVRKPLRDKLGDEAVDALIELLNQAQAEQKNGILQFVEEKFERRLSEEMAKLEVRLDQRMSGLEVRIEQRMSAQEVRFDQKASSLETKIAETKADLIKWMFIFWVGQVAVILGILFAFFKR